MNRDEILKGICDCLENVVDCQADDLREDARIIEDLGADSLDLLDLVFQLEQRFDIRITPGDIERRTRERLGDIPMEKGGLYTPQGLAELRKAMPEVPPDELQEGLGSSDLPRCFRVATFVNLVDRMLEGAHV